MKLDKLFTSHMVFAENKPIRLWGEGDGECEIIFANTSKKAVSENGKWSVEFSPMQSGGPYTLTFFHNGLVVTLDDIWVGHVYLFAGQSNIELKLNETNTPEQMYKSCEKLRYFDVDKITKNPHFSAKDGWFSANSETVGYWSALGYLAGYQISQETGKCVGIINCNQGGSVIESWLPQDALLKIGIDIPDSKKRINHTYPDYQKFNAPAALFEKQLSPLFPFSLNGIVWYQGESDTSKDEALVYDREVCELIRIYRECFMDEDLDFYVIQIADYIPQGEEYAPKVQEWKILQEAQLRIPSLTHNVSVIISADVCENDNIHPPTKYKLAERIAQAIAK